MKVILIHLLIKNKDSRKINYESLISHYSLLLKHYLNKLTKTNLTNAVIRI